MNCAGSFGLKGWIIYLDHPPGRVPGSIVDQYFHGSEGRPERRGVDLDLGQQTWQGLFSAWRHAANRTAGRTVGLFISEWTHRKNWRRALNTVRAICSWAGAGSLLPVCHRYKAMTGLWMVWAFT